MFRRKTTITRPDRDRLVNVTRAKANTLRWAIFIDELHREIRRARVVDPARISPDVVTMHSTVRLRDTGRGHSEVYTLVYPEEANVSAGNLSVLSSVGTALLGARTGDILRISGADGPRAIRLEAILHQPEADGDGRPESMPGRFGAPIP